MSLPEKWHITLARLSQCCLTIYHHLYLQGQFGTSAGSGQPELSLEHAVTPVLYERATKNSQQSQE